MTGRNARPLTLIVFLLPMVLLTSCSNVEEPIVTITGADFKGISTEGLAFTLRVDVENPNTFGADISGLTYQILIDNIKVASGEQGESVEVPAGATVEVGVPFTVVWSGMDRGIAKLTDGEEHEWKFKGNVRLSKGAISRVFSFSEKGRFDAPDVEDVDVHLDL